MKKRFLSLAGATVLALSMTVSAMAEHRTLIMVQKEVQ